MTGKKIWIYGTTITGEVLRKDWFFNTVSVANRERIAKRWIDEYGCERVYAVPDSKELKETWFDYIKTRNSKNGLAAFAQLELNDYFENEGELLAEA